MTFLTVLVTFLIALATPFCTAQDCAQVPATENVAFVQDLRHILADGTTTPTGTTTGFGGGIISGRITMPSPQVLVVARESDVSREAVELYFWNATDSSIELPWSSHPVTSMTPYRAMEVVVCESYDQQCQNLQVPIVLFGSREMKGSFVALSPKQSAKIITKRPFALKSVGRAYAVSYRITRAADSETFQREREPLRFSSCTIGSEPREKQATPPK